MKHSGYGRMLSPCSVQNWYPRYQAANSILSWHLRFMRMKITWHVIGLFYGLITTSLPWWYSTVSRIHETSKQTKNTTLMLSDVSRVALKTHFHTNINQINKTTVIKQHVHRLHACSHPVKTASVLVRGMVNDGCTAVLTAPCPLHRQSQRGIKHAHHT